MAKEKDKKDENNDLSYWESLGWKVAQSLGQWFAEKQFAGVEGVFQIGQIDSFDELAKLMQTAEESYARNQYSEQGLVVTNQVEGLSVFRGEQTVVIEPDDEDAIDADLEEEGESAKPNAPHIFETLKVFLSKDEKEKKTSELLQVMNTKDETESRFESVKKSHQAEIKDLEKDIKRIRNVVDTGAEWRDVECRQKFDYTRGIVDIFRIDTGVYVRSRQMKDAERQLQLFR